MSRLGKAARSLASGYAALGITTAYTLASIPLALHYLGISRFAVWSLVTQVASYLLLIDMGMSASISRILIDHKDTPADGEYGSVVKTGCLVLLVQGAMIGLGGSLLSVWLPYWMNVPAEYASVFRWLVAGQCLLLGVFFVGRIATHLLQAHQRFDIINYAQMVQLCLSFATQWITFHIGWGLYSLLAASFVSMACGVFVNFGAVIFLHLLPPRQHSGRANRESFRKIFAFGNELFLMAIGLQRREAIGA